METDYLPNLALRLENTAFHCEMALREALNMTDAQDASDACTVAARVSDMETYSDTEANWGLIREIFADAELARDVAFSLRHPGERRGLENPAAAILVGAASNMILPTR